MMRKREIEREKVWGEGEKDGGGGGKKEREGERQITRERNYMQRKIIKKSFEVSDREID